MPLLVMMRGGLLRGTRAQAGAILRRASSSAASQVLDGTQGVDCLETPSAASRSPGPPFPRRCSVHRLGTGGCRPTLCRR